MFITSKFFFKCNLKSSKWTSGVEWAATEKKLFIALWITSIRLFLEVDLLEKEQMGFEPGAARCKYPSLPLSHRTFVFVATNVLKSMRPKINMPSKGKSICIMYCLIPQKMFFLAHTSHVLQSLTLNCYTNLKDWKFMFVRPKFDSSMVGR